MLHYFLERLPKKSLTIKDSQVGSFSREDLENSLRELLGNIRSYLSDGLVTAISYREFTKKLYREETPLIEILERESEDQKKSKDKSSSLFKFLSPEKLPDSNSDKKDILKKGSTTNSYIVELIEVVLKFREREPTSKLDTFIGPKYALFCDEMRYCIEVHEFMLSVGCNIDDGFIRQQKNNFLYQQLIVFFVRSFEKAISGLGLGELVFVGDGAPLPENLIKANEFKLKKKY